MFTTARHHPWVVHATRNVVQRLGAAKALHITAPQKGEDGARVCIPAGHACHTAEAFRDRALACIVTAKADNTPVAQGCTRVSISTAHTRYATQVSRDSALVPGIIPKALYNTRQPPGTCVRHASRHLLDVIWMGLCIERKEGGGMWSKL